MKMQIRAFGSLMGVSVRTLQYYDEIGLLCPAGQDAQNGYRYYDEASLKKMEKILFYRRMGFSLKRIFGIMNASEDERKALLEQQKKRLQAQRAHIDRMIGHIEQAQKEENSCSVNTERNSEMSLTALMAAFGRAYHFESSKQRIFEDKFARQLITEEEYASISTYILGSVDFFAPEKKGSFAEAGKMLEYLVNTQIIPTPLTRARYCEDALSVAARTGTCQYVILGAGMDTFAFRNKQFMKNGTVYEVDHPVVQKDKLQRIERAGWELPQNLFFVPVDFSKDDLAERLLAAGFDRNIKTFFSWLGVSYYLTKEEFGRVLSALASISTQGSTLLFDYADEGLFSSCVKRVQNMIAMAAAAGEPMKTSFSYDELEKTLENHHFLIYELLTARDIQDMYFAERVDDLRAFENIGYVTAVLKK